MKQSEKVEKPQGRRNFLKVGASLGAALFGGPAIASPLSGQNQMGTTKLAHLQGNIGAIDVQFSQAELKELDDAISKITIFGDRYTPVEQSRVGN